MDIMLALTEDSVHEILWTRALLAEWERVIVREQRRSAASAAAVTAAIRELGTSASSSPTWFLRRGRAQGSIRTRDPAVRAGGRHA